MIDKTLVKKLFLGVLIFQYSCTTTSISKYYFKNQNVLDSIQSTYKEQYKQSPFSIEFTNQAFDNVSIEIITDSLKYIYEFGIYEKRMMDSLKKYNIHTPGIYRLISLMRSVHCIWVNNLDYYIDGRKQILVFMSIRAKPFYLPFKNKKYHILTYFSQPQYYDSDGKLLDHRKRNRLRKINEELFTRINDKVAYTISDRYR